MFRPRTIAGALAGGMAAGVGLRLARIAQERGVSIVDVLADLPGTARAETGHVSAAARGAAEDGRLAARTRTEALTQVLAGARRSGTNDD